MRVGYKKIQKFKREEIHMRDPFIFVDHARKKYFLFGTTLADGAGDKDPMFEVFVSEGLEDFVPLPPYSCRKASPRGKLGFG